MIEVIELAPEPGQERCDFCSVSEVSWLYPCRSFETSEEAVSGEIFIGQSVAHWAACDGCHRLIEAGNRDGLARRTYETSPPELREAWDGIKARLGERELLGQIRVLHDQFFYHRIGEAVRWSPGDAKLALLQQAAASPVPLVIGSLSRPVVLDPVMALVALAIHDALDEKARTRFLSLDWRRIDAITRRVLARLGSEKKMEPLGPAG